MLHPVYYIILFLLMFFAYKEFRQVKAGGPKLKKEFVFFSGILIFLAGFRFFQGADYPPYLLLFKDNAILTPWNEVSEQYVEPSYIVICKIIGMLGLTFPFVLIFYAVSSITLKSKTFFKFSPYPMLSLMYYFIPLYFIEDAGQIRQGLSIAITLFAFRYIVSRNLLKFLICVYVAYLFHKTAIIFVPAYWIANYKWSTLQCGLLVLAGLFLWPLKPHEFLGALSSSFSSDRVSDSFSGYSDLGEQGFGVTDIVKLVLCIVILYGDSKALNNSIKEKDRTYQMVRNLSFMYVFFFFAFKSNMILSIRLPNSYQAYWILLWPLFVKYSPINFSKKIISFLMVYILLLSWRFWPNAVRSHFNNFQLSFINSPWISFEPFHSKEEQSAFYKEYWKNN